MRVLNFHGVGSRTPPTFAAPAMKRLRKRVPELQHRSCHWGPLLDKFQEELFADMRRRGSKGNLVQGVSFKVLGDALAYRNVEESVRYLADYEAGTMGGVDVVIAHSLGVPLALGWLNSRRMTNPVTLISLGCNLALWQAGSQTTVSAPRQVTRWLNVWDASDGLGGPIAGFAPSARDVEVELKGAWYSWLVPSSDHMSYWPDAKLWERTIPNLLGR